ncbi:MAG: hypothetical protein C4520_18030 [Candidatus Abyssobacteria bacterium SURF_5]|uniref:Uncharacterized protein n=1 Tax=Abyssobacteria bacterium (strain SURF_5) TaxID=2093360 RepID=A0A3A4NB60_ABYX5|nr:MAG: hypothetical protein C4520_18030 [Candidatus Abyssubacteria bacterium SURF_5]
MKMIIDGKKSPLFKPVPFRVKNGLSHQARAEESFNLERMPRGSCVCWGIPFEVGDPVLVQDEPVVLSLDAFRSPWLVIMHTADFASISANSEGFSIPFKGIGNLGSHAADYVFSFSDGSEERVSIKRRHHVGGFLSIWGENCFEAVSHLKPRPLPGRKIDRVLNERWGWCQTQATAADEERFWLNWLWAWQNPHPEKEISGLCLDPKNGSILFMAVSAGNVSSPPIRWQRRRKTMVTLPEGVEFDLALDEIGLFKQIQLDLGQVISAVPRRLYPNENWERTASNSLPAVSSRQILVEYAAHPEAHFHVLDGKPISLKDLESSHERDYLKVLPPSEQKVTLRVIEKGTGKPVAVKLHIHGESGEYIAPIDRHRMPNDSWFQDYSVDWVHSGTHYCTYIPGETMLKLPLGRIYLEVSKGFEIRPVRKVIEIAPATADITIELERVLPWHERGWVTADTHVHFLSPPSALLEGAAEDVNVVNLLASQWGELMTNVGDFDGKTTLGSKESGGDGRYLVRVGTENRQHVLGHISLLGYSGNIIRPLCTGGPAESAIGDPVEMLLTEWAAQCKQQGGVVVIPHFPFPQCENAASIVSGNVDAVEALGGGLAQWRDLYSGINPYSLSDWYRYLNCGYVTAIVGGTDKMGADCAVGTVRTYARITPDREFTYDAWNEAIRRADTFVTTGPLLEFAVDGNPPGARIHMSRAGGRVNVTWKAASVTMPMSRVELVVNGEIRESEAADSGEAEGTWPVAITKSSWLALLVRGHYPGDPEVIVAHSSPVMIQLEGSQFLAAADAVTILEQIEGALAYIDTTGIRAGDERYKQMRLVLTSAHRTLHNHLHQAGHFHEHTPVEDHPEHRR